MLTIKSRLLGSETPFKWEKHSPTGRYIDFSIQKNDWLTNKELDVNTHPVFNVLFNQFDGKINYGVAEGIWVISDVLIPVMNKHKYPGVPNVSYTIEIKSEIVGGNLTFVSTEIIIKDPWDQLRQVSKLIEQVLLELMSSYVKGKLNYFYF